MLAVATPRLAGNTRLATHVPGQRFSIIAKGLALLTGADRQLVRSHALLWRITLLELAIILLDSATLWVLVRALGVSAPPLGLFAGFMLASVLRSIGIVPGGLGAFEAAAVVTLHWGERSRGVVCHAAVSRPDVLVTNVARSLAGASRMAFHHDKTDA